MICITINSICSRRNNGIISAVNGYVSHAICGTFAMYIYDLISRVSNGISTPRMEQFQVISTCEINLTMNVCGILGLLNTGELNCCARISN